MIASSVAAGRRRGHSVVFRGARQGLCLAGCRHCQSRRSCGDILVFCIVGVSDEVDHGASVIASALLLANVILEEGIPIIPVLVLFLISFILFAMFLNILPLTQL